jgi:hypothetical protein
MEKSEHSSHLSESHSDQGGGSAENEREGEMEKEDERTDYVLYSISYKIRGKPYQK